MTKEETQVSDSLVEELHTLIVRDLCEQPEQDAEKEDAFNLCYDDISKQIRRTLENWFEQRPISRPTPADSDEVWIEKHRQCKDAGHNRPDTIAKLGKCTCAKWIHTDDLRTYLATRHASTMPGMEEIMEAAEAKSFDANEGKEYHPLIDPVVWPSIALSDLRQILQSHLVGSIPETHVDTYNPETHRVIPIDYISMPRNIYEFIKANSERPNRQEWAYKEIDKAMTTDKEPQ